MNRKKPGYRAVVLLAIAGIATSGLTFYYLYHAERVQLAASFEGAAQDRVTAIRNAIEVNSLVLESIHSLYQTSENLGHPEFTPFAAPLLGRLYGVRALDWIPCVTGEERDAFEASWSRDYGRPFAIRESGPDGELREAGRRERYFPVLDTAPRGEPSPIAGFDLASDPHRSAAIQQAIETGKAQATPALKLLREQDDELGFQLFLPLYHAPAQSGGGEPENKAVRGLLLGVFRIPDLVEGALSELQPRGVDVSLYDRSADGDLQSLYTHSSRLRGRESSSESHAHHEAGLRVTASLDVAGRNWQIVCTAAPEIEAWHTNHSTWLVFASGLLITLLLCAYLLSTIQRTVALRNANLEMKKEIGERQRAESELERYRDQLEDLVHERTAALEAAQLELVRKEKLATIGKLIAMVSHELRNPLATMQNALFSIGEGLKKNDAGRADRALELARRSVKRCDGIIGELLDFTRERRYHFERTDIDALIAEILAEFDLPEGIECTVKLRSGATVNADREHLRRAIINVVTNAVQAMKEEKAAGNQLCVETCATESRVEMRFVDTGPGIPADILEKIFEPLFSTKSLGVGLGVPIVAEIMEGHGGGAEYESNPGAGTIVTLWVPTGVQKEY